MAKIFVVEDNQGLSDAIISYLEVDGHTPILFERALGLQEAIQVGTPDLILLDVMLPDGDGFQLARRIRKNSAIPIIFLTARTSESDRITGFELGADDYIVKPFSMRELVLRVRSVLARTMKAHQEKSQVWELSCGHSVHTLSFDDLSHTCFHDQKEIVLTATEWKILHYLAQRSGIVIGREQLLGTCLDYVAEGSERSINTHMKNIRAKLENIPWIETVRGFGYRFEGKQIV